MNICYFASTTMTSSPATAISTPPLPPPSRISHRAQGGPDLNYLYATTRYDDDDDDNEHDIQQSTSSTFTSNTNNNCNNNNNNNKNNIKQNKKQAKGIKRKTQRGRKSDTRSLRGTTLYLGGEEGPNLKYIASPDMPSVYYALTHKQMRYTR